MQLSSTTSTITSTGANAAISQEPQPSTSSCSTPANKKLKLLENLAYSDDEERSSARADDDTCNVLQESAAYLAFTVLTDDEKVSADLLFWRQTAMPIRI